jgi:hypothetical protein
VLNFLESNWLSLLSLSIALVGGVPGIVALITTHKALPRLFAYMHRLVVIDANHFGEGLQGGLILHLAVGNRGKEPLVPLAFQLDCKVRNRWIRFENAAVQEGFMVSGPDWTYKYADVAVNDIQQRRGCISRDSPVYGYLAFVTKQAGVDELKSAHLTMPMMLKCIDLFGKTHTFLLNMDRKVTSPMVRPNPRGVSAP